jgi:hypothetical protein
MKPPVEKLSKSFLFILLFGIVVPTSTIHADCFAPGDINDLDNIIICDNDPAPPEGDIEGMGGSDVIINHGTAPDDIEGDDVDGDGGNDSIVNHGVVIDDIQGDDVGGNGGHDTIINYGTVGDDIVGDDAEGNGGNDNIVNYGIVVDDIVGDGVAGSGGNDTITIYGSVGDNVEGEGGDDVVTVRFGSQIGGDIDGGTHDTGDTIIFIIEASEGEEGSAQALAAQIAARCQPNCNLSLHGMVYRISNFEGRMQFLLGSPEAQLAASAEDPLTAPLGQPLLTANEICSGPVKAFRVSNGDLEVYSGFDLMPPNGFLVARIPLEFQQRGSVFSNSSAPPAVRRWTATLTEINNVQRIVVRDASGNLVNNSCQW